MDVAALERALDEAFDHAVLYHGFTNYMRDYEVIVHMTADPRTGIAPASFRYLFRYCVEADCRTTVRPEVWRDSLDDRLINHKTGVDLDGYVWGVKWHCLYPGGQVVVDSTRARAWAQTVGIDFPENPRGRSSGGVSGVRWGPATNSACRVSAATAWSALGPGVRAAR